MRPPCCIAVACGGPRCRFFGGSDKRSHVGLAAARLCLASWRVGVAAARAFLVASCGWRPGSVQLPCRSEASSMESCSGSSSQGRCLHMSQQTGRHYHASHSQHAHLDVAGSTAYFLLTCNWYCCRVTVCQLRMSARLAGRLAPPCPGNVHWCLPITSK
jgi:hypothetical protein